MMSSDVFEGVLDVSTGEVYQRCVGLEDRLLPLMRFALRKDMYFPCVVQLPGGIDEIRLTRERSAKPSLCGSLMDWLFYGKTDSVYAWLGQEVELTPPGCKGSPHFERWGIAAVEGSGGVSIRLGIEERTMLGFYRFARHEMMRYYLPALAGADDLEGSVDSFLTRGDLLASALERRFKFKRSRVMGTLFIDDPLPEGCMIGINGLVYIQGGLCGYCGRNGEAGVPLLKMRQCGSSAHEDCIVKAAKVQSDGSGIAECFVYGCDDKVLIPKKVMDQYLDPSTIM